MADENKTKVKEVKTENAEKPKKPKKKVQNKFGAMLFDIWTTSRKYSRKNEEAYRKKAEEDAEKGKKQGWSSTEKLYLIIIVAGLIAILIKYVIL